MANIRNSISLTDRMTPTLRSILKAMDSTLRVMKNLDKASNNGQQSKAYKRAEKDIKRANNALIKMKNYTDRTGDAASKASSKYERMGSSVNSAARGMGSLSSSSSMFLQSLASGVYLAEKLASAIGGAMTTADAALSQVARLGLYNTSDYTNEELYGQVFRTAMDARSGLTETSDLANKILISGVYSGENSVQSAIGTADLINRAMVAGGGTSEENQRAIRQLTQGLASGVLQGDELRSIREQTPYFAQVLAEGLSKIDEKFEGIGIGDLKALGSEGELTSERVIKALWAMQDEINSDFESMPKTFGQAMTSLQNMWEYFLWLLNQAGGPLARLNELIWQFVDYLQTPQGFELMDAIAYGINVVATGIIWVAQQIGNFVMFLQENASVAQAIFFALAAAAVIAGISAAIAWIAAAWPILLIIALVGILVYTLLEAGFTISEIVGWIAGGIMAAIAVIWDIILAVAVLVVWAVIMVAEAVTAVGAGIILVIQGIVQLILWAILTVISIFAILWEVIVTVFKGLWGAAKGAIVGVYSMFVGLGKGVLSILQAIAQGIDWVFGSNLAGAVGGWIDGLDSSVAALNEALDPMGEFESIGDGWKNTIGNLGQMWAGEGEYDDWNILDNMGDTLNTTGDIMGDLWDMGTGANAFLDSQMQNPADWFDSGYEWGTGVVDSLGSLDGLGDLGGMDSFGGVGGLGDLSDSLSGLGNDVTVGGGNLDSVGSINSDVDISDEDLQLLRDMAAREYLLQLQTITPVAHVNFGDVRETADVNKIVEVIEQMVEEQMATALVS